MAMEGEKKKWKETNWGGNFIFHRLSVTGRQRSDCDCGVTQSAELLSGFRLLLAWLAVAVPIVSTSVACYAGACLCLGLSTDWKSEALQLLIKWRSDSFQFDITLWLCMFPYIGHFQSWSFNFGGLHDNNIDGLFGPQTNSLSCRGLIKKSC